MSSEGAAPAGLTVGVVGLGAMGGAVARRLLAGGFDTVVADIDDTRVSALVDLGARRADGRIATGCDVVITSLPADDAVRAVLLGDDGLLPDLAGRTLVELSTILPATMREVAEAGSAHDVRVIDCPVSGGPVEALAGQLVLLIGAERAEDVEAVAPVLETLGRIVPAGGIGDAKLVKLINNVIVAGNLAVAAEAFTLGTRLGLDPRRLYELLDQSGGQSRTFTKRVPYLLQDDLTARFPLHLAEKDVRLFLEVATGAGSEPPVSLLVQTLYADAIEQGRGALDMVAIFLGAEEWSAPRDRGAVEAAQ